VQDIVTLTVKGFHQITSSGCKNYFFTAEQSIVISYRQIDLGDYCFILLLLYSQPKLVNPVISRSELSVLIKRLNCPLIILRKLQCVSKGRNQE